MQPANTTEKELHYRNRVQELLRKHTSLIHRSSTEESNSSETNQQYAPEQRLIDRIVSNERTAFMYGIALSGIVFASVRFGPRYLAVKIGGREKERVMKEAEEVARKEGTAWIHKGAAFIVETSFGAWAGWRGYNIVSSQNNDSFEAISQIPLCAGRSIIADKVCSEWVDLVHKEIPSEFWQTLDSKECRLQDEARWRSVRDFADNCVKRKAFEDAYRKKHGMKETELVMVPDGGVPKDILLTLHLEKGRPAQNNTE
ncbi:hypothetical protein HJC23_001392 [Cyclotella cryptica]|uniref:Uncharacterized protein n=1 Tax=Cyclotella cryptica TaxID=29204 RepID=A0ABD3P8A7_9STRA|eukprot:CCRYP_016725-RA/>CCRYP_016725-RA protein AED:0.04 eAED:0.04 QI:296/1/1/1/1/1/3/19/256